MSIVLSIFGILFLIILFAIPSGIREYYKTKLDKQSREMDSLKLRFDALKKQTEDKNTTSETCSTDFDAHDFLMLVGRKHQFEVEELDRNDEWITCRFTYQGGHFVCHTGIDGGEMLLHYGGVDMLPYSVANYEKVRTICQRFTKDTKYTKVFHTYDATDNMLKVHISVDAIQPTEFAFMNYVHFCFPLANHIREALREDNIVLEEERIHFLRDRYMLVKAELAHEAKVVKLRSPHTKAPNHGALGEYIAYLFTEEKIADLISLRVQSENGMTEIRQRDKIASFDILGSIIREDADKPQFLSYEPVVLTVDAVANHYVFTLHPLETYPEFLTVRMTAVCTPHEFLQDYVPDATYEPQAISMLMCYVISELPEDADGATELASTGYAKQVKHGQQLVRQKAYLQAIAVLTPINKELKIKFFQLTNKEKELYFSTCYYLGFAYTDLRLYEKALYYLEIANTCNRFDYSQEYICCLSECRDARIFGVLNNEREAIGKQIEEIDKDDDRGTEDMVAQRERLVDYHAFLQRRLGYSQINFGYLDDAESTFKKLLDHEGSRDYAEHELQYIELLRKQKK